MPRFIILAVALIAVVSCKTQEEIRKEKMLNDVNLNMVQNQKMSADFSARLRQLEEQISSISGKQEEGIHGQRNKINDLDNRIKLLEENSLDLQNRFRAMESTLSEQSKYLQQVLNKLNDLSGSGGSKGSKKKTEERITFANANSHYQKGNYQKATEMYQELIDRKLISGKTHAEALHNLGVIEFLNKNEQTAIVYFSKLISEHKSSNYHPNALLVMAKSFIKTKNENAAKGALQTLIKNYPKSDKVKEAEELLKKL